MQAGVGEYPTLGVFGFGNAFSSCMQGRALLLICIYFFKIRQRKTKGACCCCITYCYVFPLKRINKLSSANTCYFFLGEGRSLNQFKKGLASQSFLIAGWICGAFSRCRTMDEIEFLLSSRAIKFKASRERAMKLNCNCVHSLLPHSYYLYYIY